MKFKEIEKYKNNKEKGVCKVKIYMRFFLLKFMKNLLEKSLKTLTSHRKNDIL